VEIGAGKNNKQGKETAGRMISCWQQVKVSQSAEADSDTVCEKVRWNKGTGISPSLVGLRVTAPPNRKPRLDVMRPLEGIVEDSEIISSSCKAKMRHQLLR
jgi:hypothetical protein